MALNISNDDDHPNKMPFSGVLTKLDEPSDEAPHGTGGRKIIITSEAATPFPSLPFKATPIAADACLAMPRQAPPASSIAMPKLSWSHRPAIDR